MKINFTLWHTTKGGGSRVIFEVSNKLIKRGHEVTITAMGGEHSWFPLKASVNYIKTPVFLKWMEILSFYTKKKFGRPFRYSDVRYVVRRLFLNKIDLDMTNNLIDIMPKCDINIGTFYPTIPAVYTSGKGIPFHYVQGYDPLRYKDGKEKERVLDIFSLPIRKLVVSKWLNKIILETTGKMPIYVGNGVNMDTFYPVKKISKNTIMSMIRPQEAKRALDVFKVLNKVASKINYLKLIVIGDRDTLKKMIDQEEPKFEIEFINPMNEEELLSVYSNSNILLFTSDLEGFGLSPLEAMACGVNVVTTDCLGTRDFCINGYNSLVCKPGDIECLTKSIVKLLSNNILAEKLSKNGIKTAKKWSWEKVARRLEDVFKKAMKEDRGKISYQRVD